MQKKSARPASQRAFAPQPATDNYLQTETVDIVAFMNESNLEVGRFSGISLAPGVFAARMNSSLGWVHLTKELRYFRLGGQYTAVSLNYVDAYSGWVLFSSQGANTQAVLSGVAPQIPVEFLLRFKDVSPAEVRTEALMFRERLNRFDRNVASLGKVEIVQRDLVRIESELLSEISDTRNRLSIDGVTLAPKIKGSHCDFVSTRFEDQTLRSRVLSSNTVSCRAGTMRADVNDVGVSYTSGVVRIQSGVELTNELRSQLLEEVARQEFASHEDSSFQTDLSTKSECRRSTIQDLGIEGHYCTRNWIPAREFQDTVTALGRFNKDSFAYTVIRTKSMTPNATVQLVGATITSLGNRND